MVCGVAKDFETYSSAVGYMNKGCVSQCLPSPARSNVVIFHIGACFFWFALGQNWLHRMKAAGVLFTVDVPFLQLAHVNVLKKK